MTRRIAVALMVAASPSVLSAQPSALVVPTDAAVGGDGAAIVATTAGALVRPPGRDRFHYVCPSATGSAVGAFAPRAAIDAGGRFYLTSYSGLRRSSGGCDFEIAPLYGASSLGPFAQRWFSDVEISARGPVWACTADGIRDNDVYVAREADGPFRSTHLESARVWYLSVGLGGGAVRERIYVSGYRVAGDKGDGDVDVAASLAVSVDDGASFKAISARGLILGRSQRSRIALVAAPDRLYVIAEGALEPGRDVLFRSTDSGESFVRALEARGRIVGVAAARGAVWVATDAPCSAGDPDDPGCVYRYADDGSFASEDMLAGKFEAYGAPQLSCLVGDQRGSLVACRADAASSGIALISIALETSARQLAIAPVLRLADVAAPCGRTAVQCASEWSRACRVFGADCGDSPADPLDPEARPPEPPPPPGIERWIGFAIALGVAALLPFLIASRRRE